MSKKKQQKAPINKFIPITIILGCIIIAMGIIIGALIMKDNKSTTQEEVVIDTDIYCTVGEHELTESQYSFYYVMAINSYLKSVNASSLADLGIDESKPLSQQPIDESEPENTWYQLFTEVTTESIQNVYCIYDKAIEDGFKLEESEDIKADYIDSLQKLADNANKDFSEYIKLYFCDKMSEETLNKELEIYNIAIAYDELLHETTEIPDADIKKYFDDDPQGFNTIDYDLYYIIYDNDATTSDPANIIYTRNDALELAQNVLAAKSDSEFEKLAHDNSPDAWKAEILSGGVKITSVARSDLMTTYQEWIESPERKEGDIELFEDEENCIIYVIRFINAYLDESNTVDFASMRISKDNLPENSEMTLDEMVAVIWENVYEEDGCNPDERYEAFISYAKAISETSKYVYNGYYNGKITNDKMNNWLFEEGRKYGDVAAFDVDNAYYIIFYISDDEPYWQYTCRAILKDAAYDAYMSKLIEEEYKFEFK